VLERLLLLRGMKENEREIARQPRCSMQLISLSQQSRMEKSVRKVTRAEYLHHPLNSTHNL